MPGKFKHEEVSAVPRGYRVRTVKRGRHEIRVAFPPGRRRRGAGRVVSILHPVGENPSCPIRQIADRLANPGECKCGSGEPATFGGMCARCARGKAAEARARAAQIRGARNPDSHRISWSDEMVRRLVAAYQGWRRAGMGHRDALDRTLNDTTAGKGAIAEFRRRIARPGFGMNPELIDAIRPGSKVTFLDRFGQQRTGRAVMRSSSGGWVLNMGGRHGTPQVVHADMIVRVRSNPQDKPRPGERPEQYHERKVREMLAKMPKPIRDVFEREARRRPNPDELAAAEDLYREFHGREPHEILEMQESDLARRDYTALGDAVELHFTLPDGRLLKIAFTETDKVKVVSSPDGRQLYLLGGDQNIAGALGDHNVDTSRDLIDLGDAVFISYDASKWQTDFKPTIWEHELGEESGIHPRGFFDKLKRRIFFAGGNYRVERPGIID